MLFLVLLLCFNLAFLKKTSSVPVDLQNNPWPCKRQQLNNKAITKHCNVQCEFVLFFSWLSQSKHGIYSAGKFEIEKAENWISALVESFLSGFQRKNVLFAKCIWKCSFFWNTLLQLMIVDYDALGFCDCNGQRDKLSRAIPFVLVTSFPFMKLLFFVHCGSVKAKKIRVTKSQ